MANKPVFSASQQEKAGEMLLLAREGNSKFSWLHKLALKAGYASTFGKDPTALVLVPPLALARGFRVNERTVKTWMKEGMPCHEFSVGNKPALYDIFEVIRWREKRSGANTEDPDPLMRGGNSPALERQRLAKAKEAERKNKEAEGKLVDVASISFQLAEIGRAFRTRAEAIERTYGEKIGAEIRRMVDETQAEWEKRGLRVRRKK